MRPREPSSIVLRSRWYQSGVGVRAERADERTRTADLLQLRVIHQALQGCAQACKCRIPKPLSILWVAACCTVLRSQWYQSGIRRRWITRRGFLFEPHPRPRYEKPRPWSISGSAVFTIEISSTIIRWLTRMIANMGARWEGIR